MRFRYRPRHVAQRLAAAVLAHAVHGDMAAEPGQAFGKGAADATTCPVTSATWPSSIRSGIAVYSFSRA
jgi:hypothetical protein